MSNGVLAAYLDKIGVPQRAGPDVFVLRHLQIPPSRSRRRPMDVLSLLAPQKPLDLELRIDGELTQHRLRRGDIAIAPPFFAAEINISAFDGVIGWIHGPVLAAAARALDPTLNGSLTFRRVPQIRDPLLSSLVLELSGELEQAWPRRPLYLEALATSVLGHIVNRYVLQPTETRMWGKSADDGRIRRTMEYLETRLAEDISLAETARHVGLSPPHLAEVFKAGTGETISAFVRRRRLEYGQILLLQTDMGIADIAHRVGYASPSHFATAFKTMFGVGPGQYRTKNALQARAAE